MNHKELGGHGPATAQASVENAAPFHGGERAVQERAGVRALVEKFENRIFREFMPEQHRTFYEGLPYVVLGTLDASGQPHASMLFGAPGFMSSPDPQRLLIDSPPSIDETLAQNLTRGGPMGLLGIEFHTRRRNRMNGTVLDFDERGFLVKVKQSFGNCPKYIQAREARFSPEDFALSRPSRIEFGPSLPARALELIGRCDTFFIASASAHATGDPQACGLDVSHRGGKPGFVRAEMTTSHERERAPGHVLTWPDFAGNNFFNTLGNLEVNPRAGLYFLDFETGDAVALTGSVVVTWDGADLQSFRGAERLLRFSVDGGWLKEAAAPLRWSPARLSKEVAQTGTWT